MTFAVRCTGLDVPEPVRTRLDGDDVAAQPVAENPGLWGSEAELEASVRPGWLDLPATSRPLVGRLAELRAELQFEGLDRVVLCGTRGSAPSSSAGSTPPRWPGGCSVSTRSTGRT